VAPDLGGHEQEAESRGRQRCVSHNPCSKQATFPTLLIG
jgi:hypothetical protein